MAALAIIGFRRRPVQGKRIPAAMGIAGTPRPFEEPCFRAPILLVVGSRASLAHEQADEARRSSGMTRVLDSAALANGLDSGNDVMAVIDSCGEAGLRQKGGSLRPPEARGTGARCRPAR